LFVAYFWRSGPALPLTACCFSVTFNLASIIPYFAPGANMTTHSAARACLVGERDGFLWYHIDAPQNPPLDELAREYHLHELAVEDCRTPGTRAKVDEYGEILFAVANLVRFDPEERLCSFLEIDFFLRSDVVISVCDGPDPIIDQVRLLFQTEERLAQPGRLFHRILDGMVDRYLPVLDTIEERIEVLEEQALEHSSPKLLGEVFSLKRSLIEFRRVTISMRDMVGQILRRREPWLESENLYFRDVYDHLLRAMEFTETYRDILTGVLEVHLTAAANRTNDIVKVMTLFATITLPILLITGYYGMNFEHLPLLHNPYGGYIATGLMTLMAGGMLYAFKKTGWF
jgi:magnesium transporter